MRFGFQLLLLMLVLLDWQASYGQLAQLSLVEAVPPGSVQHLPEASGNWLQVEAKPQAASQLIYRLGGPMSAKRVRLTLFFKSRQAGRFYRQFRVSATRDAQPRAGAEWQPMFPTWFGSTEGELKRETDGYGLRHEGVAEFPILKADFSLPFDGVTGLRFEVGATGQEETVGPALLTDLHFQAFNTFSTNVALGCPVSASHPLAQGMHAGYLTDGLQATYSHPAQTALKDAFYFEIDFKRRVELDHLQFRTKPDALQSNRFTQMRLRLYDDKPADGAKPIWETLYRANGSVPDIGSEIVRPAMGRGRFHGRYLRISTESEEPYAPQIAEVEAYETMLPTGAQVTVGDKTWPLTQGLEVPATSWLTFRVGYPALSDPVGLGKRWRLAGFHSEWQVGSASGVVETRCPPPGEYELQAQIRHTDQQWNAEYYAMPFVIPVPFWQRTWPRVAVMGLGAAVVALLAWQASRRAMKRQVAELEQRHELATERARIARDMHDAVGSQLTQLTVMHEILAEEVTLPPDARARLRQLTEVARASAAALDAVVWAVNPTNDTLANVSGYLTHAAREYLVPLGISCREDVPHDWPTLAVSSHARHQLYLAFREALQNILKHAQATQVTLVMRLNKTAFTVQLADNGVGLKGGLPEHDQDGLRNMRTRLAAAGGRFDIQPNTHGGTLVTLEIPVPS